MEKNRYDQNWRKKGLRVHVSWIMIGSLFLLSISQLLEQSRSSPPNNARKSW